MQKVKNIYYILSTSQKRNNFFQNDQIRQRAQTVYIYSIYISSINLIKNMQNGSSQLSQYATNTFLMSKELAEGFCKMFKELNEQGERYIKQIQHLSEQMKNSLEGDKGMQQLSGSDSEDFKIDPKYKKDFAYLDELSSETKKKQKKRLKEKMKAIRKRIQHQKEKQRQRAILGVRRPTNPFMEFLIEQRTQMRELNPTVTSKEITVKIADKWKQLTSQQKKVYMKKFQAARDQYNQRLQKHEQGKLLLLENRGSQLDKEKLKKAYGNNLQLLKKTFQQAKKKKNLQKPQQKPKKSNKNKKKRKRESSSGDIQYDESSQQIQMSQNEWMQALINGGVKKKTHQKEKNKSNKK